MASPTGSPTLKLTKIQRQYKAFFTKLRLIWAKMRAGYYSSVITLDIFEFAYSMKYASAVFDRLTEAQNRAICGDLGHLTCHNFVAMLEEILPRHKLVDTEEGVWILRRMLDILETHEARIYTIDGIPIKSPDSIRTHCS